MCCTVYDGLEELNRIIYNFNSIYNWVKSFKERLNRELYEIKTLDDVYYPHLVLNNDSNKYRILHINRNNDTILEFKKYTTVMTYPVDQFDINVIKQLSPEEFLENILEEEISILADIISKNVEIAIHYVKKKLNPKDITNDDLKYEILKRIVSEYNNILRNQLKLNNIKYIDTILYFYDRYVSMYAVNKLFK